MVDSPVETEVVVGAEVRSDSEAEATVEEVEGSNCPGNDEAGEIAVLSDEDADTTVLVPLATISELGVVTDDKGLANKEVIESESVSVGVIDCAVGEPF